MYGQDDMYGSPMQPGRGVFSETLQVTMDEIDDEFGDDYGFLGLGRGGGIAGIALTKKAKKKKVARLLGKLKKFIALEEAGKKVNIKKVWGHAKTMSRTLKNLEKKGYDLNDEEQAWTDFYEAGKGDEQAWEDLKDKLGGVSGSTGDLVTQEAIQTYHQTDIGGPPADGGGPPAGGGGTGNFDAGYQAALTASGGGGVRGGLAMPQQQYYEEEAYYQEPPRGAYRRRRRGWRPPAYPSFPHWKKRRWLARHPRLALARHAYDPPGWQPGMRPMRRPQQYIPGRQRVVTGPRGPRTVFRRPGRFVPGPGRRPARRPARRPGRPARRPGRPARPIRRRPAAARGRMVPRKSRSTKDSGRPLFPKRQRRRSRGRFGLDEAIESGVYEAMGGLPGTIGIDAFEESFISSPSGLLRADILESTAIDDFIDAEDIYADSYEDFGLHEFDDFGDDDEEDPSSDVRSARLQKRTERRMQRAKGAGPAGVGPFRRKLTARLAALEKKYKHQADFGHPDMDVTFQKLQAVKAHYNEMLGKPKVQTVMTVHEQEGIEQVPLFQSRVTPVGWGVGPAGEISFDREMHTEFDEVE